VTVTGVDDGSADGQDVIISLTINTALTADPLYLAVDPHDVVVTNADETAVLFVSKVLASRQQAHVRVGEIVRYNIVTRNDGASAQRLTLTDTLPAKPFSSARRRDKVPARPIPRPWSASSDCSTRRRRSSARSCYGSPPPGNSRTAWR